ncbi:hypothetical protein BDW74DRAFT_85948 [Aspergillus multicolor]|uniref:uncharacterized protein n=1 Tax=Aspergillus multicolor TaxID=41759 RepID=UPI003CCD3E32
MPLFKDKLGISISGRDRSPFSVWTPSPCVDQVPTSRASRRVPSSYEPCSSQTTTSRILGLPKTLEMPPSLNNSAVPSETQESSSFSASPGASLALPTKARRDEFPQMRMTETTAVRIPSGHSAKIRLSRRLVDSARNCFVSRSPKRATSGA